MSTNRETLFRVYEGWDGYHQSIVQAITPLTRAQLAWRPIANLRSVGELVRHIAFGRLDCFLRIDAPGSHALAAQISEWEQDPHGNQYVMDNAIPDPENIADLVRWLEDTWDMIAQTLKTWTVDDLMKTYRHTWRGNTYAVSYQWTIWRILAHDIHHGGELAVMLGMQGLASLELGDLGGHIIEPPVADAA